MKKRCMDCEHARSLMDSASLREEAELVGEDMVLIECLWEPPALPESWQYTRREVTTMQANDGQHCPQFVRRN